MGCDSETETNPGIDYLEIGRFRVPALGFVVGTSAVLFFIGVLVSDFNPPIADVKYDWLTAREAVALNGDAYAAVTDLADKYGVEIDLIADPSIDISLSHPRTPAALLFQLPLLLVPFNFLFASASVISFLCIAWLATDRIEVHRLSVTVSLIGVLAIAPTFVTLRFAGQAALVALLALVGWRLTMRDRPGAGGAMIGVASALKVFPLLLLVPLLLQRRWKASIWLVGTLLVANLLGLSLPGVALDSAIDGLLGAASLWRDLYSNGSGMRILQSSGFGQVTSTVVVVGLMGFATLALIRKNSWSPFGFLAIGLLVIPLSWVSYDLVLVPAAILMVASSDRVAFYAGVGVVGSWLLPILLPLISLSSGLLSTIARCVVLATALFRSVVFSSWSLDSYPNQRGDVLH